MGENPSITSRLYVKFLPLPHYYLVTQILTRWEGAPTPSHTGVQPPFNRSELKSQSSSIISVILQSR